MHILFRGYVGTSICGVSQVLHIYLHEVNKYHVFVKLTKTIARLSTAPVERKQLGQIVLE